MRRIWLFVISVAAVDALAAPARGQDEPIVEPIPAPDPEPAAPAAPGALAAPAPQAEDDEAAPASRSPDLFGPKAPPTAEPEASHAGIALVWGLIASLAALEISSHTSGDRRWWYAGAVLAGGAVGTGAIVCALGHRGDTRPGGCKASIAGALIGAATAIPGLLLMRAGAQSCAGPNADGDCWVSGDIDSFLGLVLAGGYMFGTTYGAYLGWHLGTSPAATAPGPPVNVSLLSLEF